jgi:hypothetical protein
MARSRTLAVLISAPVLLVGCSGSAAGAAPGSSLEPASSAAGTPVGGPSTPAPAPTDPGPGWGSLPGCPAGGGGVPPDAVSGPAVDVDGDGRSDTQWIARQPGPDGGIDLGATTASGDTFSTTFRSASPVARSVLFADVTGAGQVVAFASDGRQVALYAVQDCSLVAVLNVQGDQYAFDRGFTGYGTGVGCADADGDGVRDLVGLQLVTADDGTPQRIERTIVLLDGTHARNGATDSVPVTDPAEVAAATQVTCGDLNLADDGVASEP